MKFVKVKDTELKVGDIAWDVPSYRYYATKFEVVSINLANNTLYVKYIGGRAFGGIKLNETIELFISGYTWYREEASND